MIGQNTGTNLPRMMSNLVEARKRGVPIVAVNPMPERALVRFADPQDVLQMATFGSTKIASEFVHIRIGGDLALLKGMMKVIFEREARGARREARKSSIGSSSASTPSGWTRSAKRSCRKPGRLSSRFPAWTKPKSATAPKSTSVPRSRATMICYSMGLTQRQEGSRLQQVVNLPLLKGNFGKPGAGIFPIRGHSNVQGDRMVGVDEASGSRGWRKVMAEAGNSTTESHG